MKLVICKGCNEPIGKHWNSIEDRFKDEHKYNKIELKQCSVESSEHGYCKECYEKKVRT